MEEIKVLEPDLMMKDKRNICNDKHYPADTQDWFRPDYSPFFKESLEVRNGKGQILKLGTDYVLEGLDPILSHLTGVEVYRFVRTLVDIGEFIEFDYHSLGYHGVPLSRVAQLVTDITDNKREIDFNDQVIGKPDTYPGIDHVHLTAELTGFHVLIGFANNMRNLYKYRTGQHYYLNQANIVALAKVFNERRLAFIKMVNDHETKEGNTHGLTRDNIGLGLVRNYPLAPVEIDAEGLSQVHYSTPGGLSAFMKNQSSYSSLFIKQGETPFDQYYTDEHTQFLTIEKEHPEITFMGGYWQPTLSGGYSVLGNYHLGNNGQTARWSTYTNNNGLTIPYATEGTNRRAVNSPDGSVVLIMTSANRWLAEIPATGKSFYIETASMPIQEDWIKVTNVFYKNETIYLTTVYKNDQDSPHMQIYSVSTLGKQPMVTLRLNMLRLTFKDEAGEEHKEVFEYPLYWVEKEQGKYVRWGKPLPKPGTVQLGRNLIQFMDATIDDEHVAFKVIQPLIVIIDGKGVETFVEKSFSFYLNDNTLDYSYETLRYLNLPFDMTPPKDDDFNIEVLDYFFKLGSRSAGVAINILPDNTLLVLTNPEDSRVVQLPYTRRNEIASRPWLPYLEDNKLFKPEVNDNFLGVSNNWEIAVPSDSFCFLNGIRLPIKRTVIDVLKTHRRYGQTEYTLYIGIDQNEARYFIHPLNDIDRPGFLPVASIEADSANGITKLEFIKEQP